MVDQFLCFFLCQNACFQVSLDIDIQECGYTTNTHCCSVLSLDCCQISEVQPLCCFFCVFRRYGNIESVRCSHFFHFVQSFHLICKFFTKTEISSFHSMSFVTFHIVVFFLQQEIDTVQSYTTVIAYDTSTTVSIRQTGNDFIVTGNFHLVSIDIEYTLVMCFMIFCEDFMQFLTRCISVCCAGFLSHLYSTVRHECSLQRFVCLQTNDCFQIFHAFIDISRAICCDTGNYFCFHIQNAAFCTFFFLQLLQFSPQFICCLCRSLQESFISVIWCVVALNEVTYIYGINPVFTLEAFPLFKLSHCISSCVCVYLNCYLFVRCSITSLFSKNK